MMLNQISYPLRRVVLVIEGLPFRLFCILANCSSIAGVGLANEPSHKLLITFRFFSL